MHQFLFKVLIRLIVVITALPIHEYAHGLVAYWLGDHTAKSQGRLNLNPLKHFDLIGTTALLLTGFGWAKPVPINPYNFRNSKIGIKGGVALTALAGPLSNILVAGICLIVYKLCWYLLPPSSVVTMLLFAFSFMMNVNLGLAVFNLLPVPPLDGSRIVSCFIPDQIAEWTSRHEKIIFIALFFVMYSGILNGPINFITNLIFKGLNFITGLIDLLAGVL